MLKGAVNCCCWKLLEVIGVFSVMFWTYRVFDQTYSHRDIVSVIKQMCLSTFISLPFIQRRLLNKAGCSFFLHIISLLYLHPIIKCKNIKYEKSDTRFTQKCSSVASFCLPVTNMIRCDWICSLCLSWFN